MIKAYQWELHSALFGTVELQGYLTAGWEPFAVANEPHPQLSYLLQQRVFVRRPIKNIEIGSAAEDQIDPGFGYQQVDRLVARGVSARTYWRLLRAYHAGELLKPLDALSDEDLLGLLHFGPLGLQEVRNALAAEQTKPEGG